MASDRATLGFASSRSGTGTPCSRARVVEFVVNPLGVVPGGSPLTLVDSATGCAVQTRLPEESGTLETKANFVRPILADTGALRAVGRAIPRRADDRDGRGADRGSRGAAVRTRDEHAPRARVVSD